MIQTTSGIDSEAGARPGGLHVAIIMDGNGRWAEARGLPRTHGHRRGAEAVREVVAEAAALGVGTLTLFAFSADNWKRPTAEVRALLALLAGFLRSEARALARRGIRLSAFGRRDRLPAPLRRTLLRAEALTAGGRAFHLRVAIDYSARDAIAEAARRPAPAGTSDRQRASPSGARGAFAGRLAAVSGGAGAPDVDLLIRTGGEQRLSDFLLWESAYAELVFTERPWPEFDRRDLAAALAEFHRRQRRFGGLLAPQAVAR